MATKVWFTNDPVLMVNIDVEGDGKQVVSRPATEQDKANYSAQLSQMQGGGTGGTGGAASTQAASQQQTQTGATGAAGQPPSPGANP